MNGNSIHRKLGRLALPLIATALLAGCGSDSQTQALEHMERGQTYAEQGQFRAAIIEMRNAIETHPDSVEPALQLAGIMLDVGTPASAANHLEPWLERERERVTLPLAQAYIGVGKHVSAREVLEGYQAQDASEQSEIYRIQAEAARLRNQVDTSVEYFEAALEQNPGNARALAGLNRVRIENDQLDGLRERTEAWLNEHGANPDVLLTLSQKAYQENRLELASDQLVEALDAVPSADIFLPIRREILSALSRTLTEMGRADEAMIYNRILAENTNEGHRETLERAVEAIGEGDLATARTTLEELMRVNPDSQMVGLLLGAVNLQDGDLEAGESLLSEHLDPEIAATPFIQMAAMAQVDSGKRDQALQSLDRALLARPSDVNLLAMHGVIALADPATSSAGLSSLNKALELDNSQVRLRMALAQYHMGNEEQEQALGHLRAAFDRAPNDWAVTEYYLTTLFQLERDSEASDVRNHLVSDFPDHPNANYLVARHDFRSGDQSDGLQRMNQVVSDNEDWTQARLSLAQMYADSGNEQQALEHYILAAAQMPDQIGPLEAAGRLYAIEHTPDEVIDWLLNVRENQSELGPITVALAAQIRLQQGQIQAAQELLQLERNSNNRFTRSVRARQKTALARQAAGQESWEEARTALAEAISIEPENPSHQFLLARIITAEGDSARAIAQLDDLESDYGPRPDYGLTRATVLAVSEDLTTAYQYLEEHWQTHRRPEVMPELVNLARQTNNDTAALIDDWLEVDPQNGNAWRLLGDHYLSTEDYEESRQAYRNAIEHQPENVIALNNLAWLLHDVDVEESVELASRAAELAPENPAVLDTYGWALHLSGDHERARETLMYAHELDPDNADIRENLATVESHR